MTTEASLKFDAAVDRREQPTSWPSGDPIAFVDLQAQRKRIKSEIDNRIAAVLEHGQFVNGPEVPELERALADWTGAADVVLCGNGTEALEFALMGEGVGAGDAVFIPAFTYNATASAVIMVGATPVFVDVDERTFNIDPADLAAKVAAVRRDGTLVPRAIIPVDLFGLPADYSAMQEIASEHDMIVVADAAQSFGGKQGDAWVGNIAPMTATSFFPAKPLGCYGDGGAIFTRDAARADIWRSIRWHGTDESRKESVRLGTNGRLDSIQAAVVLTKLSIFDDELARRHQIAALYDSRLQGHVQTPARPDGLSSGWSLYSIVLDERDRIQAALSDAEIPSAIYYKIPLHRMRAFSAFAPKDGLPVCERLSERILSLPMHPYLTDNQVHRVCDTVLGAL